jgi:beta-lactam-binding protein with PASTA domain/tRNA A-37 threonylcarbamoyl transferase component Bud32
MPDLYTRKVSVNSTDPMIGRLLDGRYQIRSRIARGGMATVYLADDLRLERRVAIKVMHGHLADDSQFKERFIQEARSAARLAHPNVVNVFDQGQDSDMAYLVMEYLPGITLRDLLQEHKVLTTEQTLDIMEAVLGGLAAAHKAGIVHRDLKPENVLLADDGRIKIGDFGLARAASANTATGAALLGTIAYLSPELVTRGIADTRSDIYALGIMMYEMLVGEQPFTGDQPMQIAYQHANDFVPAPSIKNPRIPVQLDELVLWATSREPDDRPHDARVLLDRLFEVHSALLTSSPTGATIVQRTMVMPTAGSTSFTNGGTAETQVFGTRAVPASTPPIHTSAATLTATTKTRRKRGVWITAIVTVIVLLAAGTGWYFGWGPGSRITLPETIAGLSADEATVTLQDLGLTVSEERLEANHPLIPVGLVVETNPPLGSQVAPDSPVTLVISTGPQLIALPALAGMTEEAALEAIKAAPFTSQPSLKQFDGEIPPGIVIDALSSDGASLAGVAEYGELQPISLVVSVGPVPDVTGMTTDQAIAQLAEVGLAFGAARDGEFSDTIAAGSVLRAQALEGATVIRVGDSIDLILSRGVELIEVPNVVGMTWLDARPELESAGFSLNYAAIGDIAPAFVIVSGLTPGAGERLPKGSTITISFTL